jgi:hypothetical protein
MKIDMESMAGLIASIARLNLFSTAEVRSDAPACCAPLSRERGSRMIVRDVDSAAATFRFFFLFIKICATLFLRIAIGPGGQLEHEPCVAPSWAPSRVAPRSGGWWRGFQLAGPGSLHPVLRLLFSLEASRGRGGRKTDSEIFWLATP